MRLFAIDASAAEAELVTDRCWQAGAAGIWEQAALAGQVVLRVGVEDGDAESFTAALFDLVPRDVTESDLVELATRTVEVGPADDPVHLHVPGTVFGDGLHPTTATCFDVVSRVVRPGTSVLDVGCGSGALSVVAARAGAVVTALDVDPVAVAATLANAESNGVTVAATTTPLAELDGTWDLVLANISAQALLELAEELWRVCTGTLVVSGILTERWPEVRDRLGGSVGGVHDVEGWVTSIVTR